MLMSRESRHRLSLVVGVVVLGLLLWLTVRAPPSSTYLVPGSLFTVLIVFTTTFGVPLGGGEVSLLPMTIAAAYLALGPIPTAWASFIGALLHGGVRQAWSRPLQTRREPTPLSLLAVSAANATMHTLSILIGGQAFAWMGGVTPLTLEGSRIVSLVTLGVAYLGANLLFAGFYISSLGRAPLQVYLRSIPNLLAYEATPLIFAPLMALTYTHLGLGQFVLLSLALVAMSLISRGLALSRRRLERRVKELDSLQAVGQALSASLELESILGAVYTQVSQLMPARNFYIGMYDPETDEVSFPISIEEGERAEWRPRRLGNGLTEYILETQASLLLERDVGEHLERLGIEQIGSPAASWLGVPILAGSDSLGVIAVQSYDTSGVYDANHEHVLVTIAAQAAVAIQNARLYARTDEALTRRVQELDSILRTTREGILLLDRDWRVLAANPEVAGFLGLAQLDLVDQVLGSPQSEGSLALVGRLGYTVERLGADCEALVREGGAHKETIVFAGPPERYLERTLAPVRDREGVISGWLLIYRDVTEEVELNQFRDDMTHMLVHDLRSPLAVLRGSLEMIEHDMEQQRTDRVGHWVASARSGSDRMLHLIDELLDISKLENGQLPTRPEAVETSVLFEETTQRLATLAREAHITVQAVAPDDLPALYVDPGLMGRVLTNLVDNAIKFTPDEGIVCVWAKSDLEADGASMLVGVSDTGPGIPPEAQSRLFKKFQQVVSIEGRRRGTGLGLPFCRLAVEAHGGQIWAESPSSVIESTEEGQGTTFVMRLPTVKAIEPGAGRAKEG
jgi:NtrC-family two-component system sensor histidine kinase KinB